MPVVATYMYPSLSLSRTVTVTVAAMAKSRRGPPPRLSRNLSSLTSLRRIDLPTLPPNLSHNSESDSATRDTENILPIVAEPFLGPRPESDPRSSSNDTGNTFSNTEFARLKQLLRTLGATRGKKHSYTREEKLGYIQLYKSTLVEDPKCPGVQRPMSKRFAAKKFGITHSMLVSWLKKEDKIRDSKGGTWWMNNGLPSWPELETQLFEQFISCRNRGMGINRAWSMRTAKRIFRELYPNMVWETEGGIVYGSRFSRGWFQGFKRRWQVSWRAKTKMATKTPEEATPLLEEWMRFNRRNTQVRHGETPADIGRFYIGDFYNMDQTPLPYEFLEGQTYDIKGNRTVWLRTIRSGWHKCQATLMVTVCADGKRRLDPLIIFRGEGVGKSVIAEAEQYHPRVRVEFNAKAYSNEEVTLHWIHNDLKWATDHDLDNKPRFITLDVFSGQKTPRVLKAFKKLNFVTSFIPEGCTSYVQPLDTHLNKSFKNKISELMEAEFERDPEKWENSENFCVGDRRVLVTHCVGEAWEWLHREKKDMIIKSFRDCGLTLNVDGSEDNQIRVKDLPNLSVGNWTMGGVDCNLNRQGKTSNGKDFESNLLVDIEAEETTMFNYNPYDEDVVHSEEEEEEGEYVLEGDSDIYSSRTIQQWAERVTEREAASSAGTTNVTGMGSYQEERMHTIMDIGNLCSSN